MADKTNERYFSFFATNSTKSCRVNNLHPATTSSVRSISNNKILMWTWTTWLLVLSWNLTPTSSFCPPLCACNDVTLSVDCHEAGNLRMVPIFLNPQTRFLSLAQNQINEISMSFQFYSELTFLDFAENKIESIGQNNFENLKALRVLNASYNSIGVLEEDVFLGLTNLQVLDLSVNQIEKVGRKVLSGLRNLQELYLDRNRLDSLEWDLFQGLEKLEKLSAKYNFLRVIQPPTSFALTSSMLRLNSRESEAEAVGGEDKPKSLAPQTQIAREDEEKLWTLKSVRELDLSWNQLTRVKNYGLSVFSSLNSINLCCNYIHTIEEQAFAPYFSESGSHSSNAHLMFVNLSQNRLGRIPTDSLDKLGSLIELDLSSNGISDQIAPHSFRNMYKMQKLRLSDNPGIISIDADALVDNINLIEFEGNHLSNLTEFEAGLLNNKPYLEKFSLEFSQISTLPPELFDNPQYSSLVSTLSLLGSPLDCNCSSYPLFSWIIAQQGASSTSSITIKHTKSNNNGRNQTSKTNSNAIADQSRTNEQVHPLSQQLKSAQSLSLSDQLVCANPPKLAGVHLKDLSPTTDFENCFDQFPLLFASENFEILVIILASIIIALILVVLVVKFCCVYKMCAKCTSKLKNRRRSSCSGSNGTANGNHGRGRKRKDVMMNNCNGVMSVDEFCSNFTSSNSKSLVHEFPAVAVSPELVSKIKKTIHLTSGGINDSVNNSSPNKQGGGGVENNGLLQQLSSAGTMGRYSNGLLYHNNNSNNLLRNNMGGHSLSTMTTGLSSTTPDEEDYRQEDEYDYGDEEDEDDDEQLQNNYYRPRQPPLPPHRDRELQNYFMTTNHPSPGSNGGPNASNNKLRFDPKIQLPEYNHSSTSSSTMKEGKRSTAFNHPLHSYHHSSRHHQIPPALPSIPPPPMLLHYEYDYPEYPTNNKTHAQTGPGSGSHSHTHHRDRLPHNSHQQRGNGSSTAARIKQVPSVLV